MDNYDIQGKQSIWYLTKYQMFHILESKAMNQFIIKIWEGPMDINAKYSHLSTPHHLIEDQQGIFLSNKIFSNLWK